MRGGERLEGRIVVCAPATLPGLLDGDVFGYCAFCGKRVRHRPHVPSLHVLVCLACFYVRAEPGEKAVLTPQAIDELIDWLEACAEDVPKC